MNVTDLTPIRDVDLFKALSDSYSADTVFRWRGRGAKACKAQPINAPVFHEGKWYVSFGGCCALGRHNANGDEMTIWEWWGARLTPVEEYAGTPRTFIERLDGNGYDGLLVTDPTGKEWVVEADGALRAMLFEVLDDVLMEDPNCDPGDGNRAISLHEDGD